MFLKMHVCSYECPGKSTVIASNVTEVIKKYKNLLQWLRMALKLLKKTTFVYLKVLAKMPLENSLFKFRRSFKKYF